MQQLTLPSELVKKTNQLIRSKISISNVYASRILANLIAQIRVDDIEFQNSYSIKAKDCVLDEGGYSYRAIKNLCKKLVETFVEVETINPKATSYDNKYIVKLYPFFTEVEYHKGIITASFNQKMRPFLLEIKECFTQYNLMEYLLLPSFYSQRMFEILKSWSGLPEVVILMNELHQMLDSPATMRNDFAQFRTRVLEKAQKDIQEYTSLSFGWLPIKTGRSVEAIKFIFSDVRKSITAKEVKQAKEIKQRRLSFKRMGVALACCDAKKGVCNQQDNKKIICKMCVDFDMCADWRRRGGKPFSPTKA